MNAEVLWTPSSDRNERVTGGTGQCVDARPSCPKEACAPIPEWHICSMTVLFRCRVDPKLLKRAAKVTQELGTSLPEAVRIFVAQVARTGSVPVSLSTKSGPDV